VVSHHLLQLPGSREEAVIERPGGPAGARIIARIGREEHGDDCAPQSLSAAQQPLGRWHTDDCCTSIGLT
jgi:hypothetical protein